MFFFAPYVTKEQIIWDLSLLREISLLRTRDRDREKKKFKGISTGKGQMRRYLGSGGWKDAVCGRETPHSGI